VISRSLKRFICLSNVGGKIGCQIVFSDIRIPSSNQACDVYTNVKKGSTNKDRGPEEEISFIHNTKTDAQ
jgi:hypothetical protein